MFLSIKQGKGPPCLCYLPLKVAARKDGVHICSRIGGHSGAVEEELKVFGDIKGENDRQTR